MAVITIAKINRQQRDGISKKTGKAYSFESLGIAPVEDTLIDINGDEFERDGRWINGSSSPAVTDGWDEGDKIKIQILRKMVPGRDGVMKEVINFNLPEGVEAMVKKASATPATPDTPEDDVDPDNY